MSPSKSDDFELIDHFEASLSLAEVAAIQQWLQPTEYDSQSSEYHRHLSSQAPGTGLWICETSKYKEWQASSDHGCLWIKGVPGAGKSVTAASMVQHLQKSDGTPVLYFFFRYIIEANRRPRNLIRDFLAQLLPYSVRLQAALQPLIGTQLEDFSDERLWEYLLTGLSTIKRAYCVVDALDEMELNSGDEFLDRLNNLAVFRPNVVKLLITSRPKQYLQSNLRDVSIIHIRLEEDLVGKDIAVFVNYRLKIYLPNEDQQQLRSSLATLISQRADGLFLYARLLLEQVTPKLSIADLDIERLVNDLPVGLEEMYNQMLFQQAASLNIETQIQIFILELVTHSSRALRLNEIASVLDSTFPASMIPGTPKVIAKSACAPLLEILEDETVSVIHHSFTEFLLNHDRADVDLEGEPLQSPQFPVVKSEMVHKQLSIICMSYLQTGCLNKNSDGIESAHPACSNGIRCFSCRPEEQIGDYDFQAAKLQYPFLEYAFSNWGFHAGKYDVDDEQFFESIADFTDPDNSDFKRWLKLDWMREVVFSKIKPPTPLHIAAFTGMTAYATRLLQCGASVEAHDSHNRTPLHWACTRGNLPIASLLLQNNANPNPEDIYGVKPIHQAARRNYMGIVKLLLEAGVDPLTIKTKENMHYPFCHHKSTKGETAVEYVWRQGHSETILTMIPFLDLETLEKLLCQCCRYGKFEAVRVLLNNTAVSPNAKLRGATALYLASKAHNVEVVEFLLAKGADVHQSSEWTTRHGSSDEAPCTHEPPSLPIHGLVKTWNATNHLPCRQILRLLISAGTDINSAKDKNGNSPLLCLFTDDCNSKDADFLVVQALLQAGADPLALDSVGDSVLHRCLRGSREIKTLSLLFAYGVPANILGKDDNTILHAALENTYNGRGVSMEEVVNLLLDNGAPCDLKNKHGITAVENAAGNVDCSLETFTQLVQACTDADVLQRCVFKLAAWNKNRDTVECIRVLQSAGASLEHRDLDGSTVLLKSVESPELFTGFLVCGADPKALDHNGKGVLHHFISKVYYGKLPESLKRLTEMVDMGLDPLQPDHEGNTLLHLRARIYDGGGIDDAVAQTLLDYGLSVNSKNNRGMTPLHVHLDNWNASVRKNAVGQSLEERFYERFEIPLMNLFQRYARAQASLHDGLARCLTWCRNKEPINFNAQDSDGLTLFHLAAMRCEARMFYLIQKGSDPTVLAKHRRNALHLACGARQSNVVGYLCQNYPSMINQHDKFGRTPLHVAATSGQPESVRLLLKAGADVGIRDEEESTPLHACAEFPNEQKVWDVLSQPQQDSSQMFHDRFRPVSRRDPIYNPWYMERRHEPSERLKSVPDIASVVRLLLAASSDATATKRYDQTPLDLALISGCQDMVEELLFTVPKLTERCTTHLEEKKLASLLAIKRFKSGFLGGMGPDDPARDFLFGNISTFLPFLASDDIEWISKNGGNITGMDDGKAPLSSGQPLLHIAASKGLTSLMQDFGDVARSRDDPKTVMAWVKKQLAVNPKFSPGVENLAPTLQIACARGDPNMDMVEVLVEKCGVDVNARALTAARWAHVSDAEEGGTALHVVSQAHHWWQLEALEYLLNKGAEIDSVNEKGETPLHIACTGTTYAAMNCENDVYGYWRIEAVNLLLKSGADVNHVDKLGLTCLHKASSSPQIMRILLEHGADITAGKLSPIFPAIQIQCLETLEILLDAGVSANTVDPKHGVASFQLHYKAQDTICTALHCSSFSNLHNQREMHSVPLIKLLIERGADIYAALNERQTLLHYTFENAAYEMAVAFLECASKIKMDFNVKDSLGRTVFMAACDWIGCLPGYKHMHWEEKCQAPFLRTLELGADPLTVDNEGRNALHHLLDNREMEDEPVIQFLALDSATALLHQKDQDGFTPLNCALRVLRPAVVEVLIEMGLDLLSLDPTGATALHRIAEQCLQPRNQSWTYDSDDRRKNKHRAGALVLWEKFLALGGSVNVRDAKGAPPLFYFLSAAEFGSYNKPENWCCHLDLFPMFFSEELVPDLDFKALNAAGENALHIIAKREKHSRSFDTEPIHNKQLYEFFMRKGLDPLQEDENGRSSLDVAAACEQKGILELFQYGK